MAQLKEKGIVPADSGAVNIPNKLSSAVPAKAIPPLPVPPDAAITANSNYVQLNSQANIPQLRLPLGHPNFPPGYGFKSFCALSHTFSFFMNQELQTFQSFNATDAS